MTFAANTTIDVYRGTETDDYSDTADVEVPEPWLSGLPASIVQTSQNRSRRDTDRPQTVRSYICRLAAGTDIRDGDRIKDVNNGRLYMIDEIGDAASPVGTPPLKLTLRRIGT